MGAFVTSVGIPIWLHSCKTFFHECLNRLCHNFFIKRARIDT